MSLKGRISSPLEAGTSILDAHHLPPQILPALEYASARLARKAQHLSLVVVRREYQAPSVISPAVSSPALYQTASASPLTPASSSSTSPKLNYFGSSTVSALRQLVRSGSSSSSKLRVDTQHNKTTALMATTMTATTTTTTTPNSPRTWPKTPKTPLSPPPLTPCTPSSVTSMTTATTLTAATSEMASVPRHQHGLRLVHPPGLSAKEEKSIKLTLHKAAKKFDIRNEWLPTPISPAACGLTDQLIHRSIVQNDVLFSSEGLTLLSLDGLYSLKSALSVYSKTNLPLKLEDAVDELRRLVLASNGRKVTRSELLRSYDWLSVSYTAIEDLDEMYKRAYGGREQVGAISGMPFKAPRKRDVPIYEPFIRQDDEFQEEDREEEEELQEVQEEYQELDKESIGLALTTGVSPRSTPRPTPKPSTPKAAPILKIQTTFAPPPQVKDNGEKDGGVEEDEDEDEDEEHTARATDQQVPIRLQAWPVSSIDQMLSATVLSPERTSMKFGPKTPNGYDDISPITRGEWGFLTTDNVFRSNRTAAVETF